MARTTGVYQISNSGGEEVRAFVPHPLPPRDPPLVVEGPLAAALAEGNAALGRLAVAGAMVPSAEWFLYGFVRKEAVISSQIEGTQATLHDVLSYEATEKTDRPDDVLEICNYVEALAFARKEMSRPKGLPLSSRLLCAVHKRLMKGVRGAEKQPGEIRTSQNWIGGTRPGNAAYVPPPPQFVPEALSDLDRWLHSDEALAPLLRAGLAHVQFETIHPFLDGNGRIGRLLIALLVEHWGLLPAPLLYLSLAFMRHRAEYYRRLSAVRTDGDWEGWSVFFLECVRQAADDGVAMAQRLFTLLNRDRQTLLKTRAATIPAIRLFDQLPNHPMLTMQGAIQLLDTTKPTAAKAIAALQQANILRETTGKQRDRVYAYHEYLQVLTKDTE
ncbi:MAG TPA: Fic family protein [Pirellulales bacterium]|jgi:Fic family protein|nr:Fic family protein [Pirellulales bacterium]